MINANDAFVKECKRLRKLSRQINHFVNLCEVTGVNVGPWDRKAYRVLENAYKSLHGVMIIMHESQTPGGRPKVRQ